MATKKFQELKNLSGDELIGRARETESQLFQARMKLRTGQLEDTGTLWRLRKELARVKTLMTQKTAEKAQAR